jgi:hypothetical protein
MNRGFLIPIAVVATAALATPAQAAQVVFSGNTSGPAIVAPDATCGSIPFRGIISGASGSSSLGSFSYSHNVCTQGPAGGPIVGTFTIDFGAEQFSGTLSGASQASGTANIFDLLINYSITGGTGRFLGADGVFTGIGTANTSTRPSIVSLTFAAVPEPATWATMLLGFGLVGASMRRRRVGYRFARAAQTPVTG